MEMSESTSGEIISNLESSSYITGSNSKELSSEIESTNINSDIFTNTNSEETSTENKLTETNINLEESNKPESTIFESDKSYKTEHSTEIISDLTETIINQLKVNLKIHMNLLLMKIRN